MPTPARKGSAGNGSAGNGSAGNGSARDQVSAVAARLPGQLAGVPAELLAVCALMGVAGLLLLWPALQVLPSAFQLFGAGAGSLGAALGLLILELAVMILALGAGLLVLAVRLTRADRVARGLSYILLGGFSLSVLIGSDHAAGLIVVMLICLACLAVLAGAPAVRTFFTGPGAPHADEGVSVTIARTLLAIFACSAILLGIAFLPAGDLGGKWVIVGALLLALGAAVFALSSRLAKGEPASRVIVTGLMALYAVLDMITNGRSTVGILPLMMAVAIVGLLWIPPDAQRHFSPSGSDSRPGHVAPANAGWNGREQRAPGGAPWPSAETTQRGGPPWPAAEATQPRSAAWPAAASTQPPAASASPAGFARPEPAGNFCGRCGMRATPADKFCGMCGSPVRREPVS